MYELFVILGVVRVEVDPLKLDDGVGVHPLGGDFRVESELFDLDGSELVEVLGGAGVEEHADLAERAQVMLVLQYLHALYLLVGLSLLVYLAVLVLHLLRAVGHVDHDALQVVHLQLADPHHRVAVVLLLLAVAQRAAVQHRVADPPHVGLRLLAVLKRSLGALVPGLLEDVDEGGQFGPGGVVALVVFFGEGRPPAFLHQLLVGLIFVLDLAFQLFPVLLLLNNYPHPLLLFLLLAIELIQPQLLLQAGLFLLPALLLLGLFLALLLLLEFLELLLGELGCGFRWHSISYINFKSINLNDRLR